MIALFRALGLGLPPLLADPFAHGLAVLEQFAPFPTAIGEEDFTAPARSHLRAARRWFVEGIVPVSEDGQHGEQTRVIFQGYLFRGDHDAIIRAIGDGEVPSPARRLAAAAYALRSVEAAERVRTALNRGGDISEPLAAALADLDRAVVLAPDFAELRADRARVRLLAAAARDGAESEELLVKAHTDLVEALRIHPDMQIAVNHLALHDAIIAGRSSGPARRERFERAAGGFRRACELDPESALSLAGLARVLFELGRGQPSHIQEAEALMSRAEELQPRNFEIVLSSLALQLQVLSNNWHELTSKLEFLLKRARSLQELDPDDVRGKFLVGLLETFTAVCSREPEARTKFDAGWQTYVDVRDSLHGGQWVSSTDLERLRYFMAGALWTEAWHRDPEAGAELYNRAEAELATAAVVPGQEGAVLRWWAGLLADRADDVEGELRDTLLDRADEKFAAALEAAPGDPGILVEWAGVKVQRIAAAGTPEEARAAHDEALRLLRRAELTTETPQLGLLWARAYQSLGEALEDDPEVPGLLRQALARFEAILEVSGDEAHLWGEFGEYAQTFAELRAEQRGGTDEARAWFRKAVSAWSRAGELDGDTSPMILQAEALLASAAFEEAQGETGAAEVLGRQAEELLEAALRKRPHDRDILLLLLHVHDERGAEASMTGLLRRLARLTPPITLHELTEEEYDFMQAPPETLRAILSDLKP